MPRPRFGLPGSGREPRGAADQDRGQPQTPRQRGLLRRARPGLGPRPVRPRSLQPGAPEGSAGRPGRTTTPSPPSTTPRSASAKGKGLRHPERGRGFAVARSAPRALPRGHARGALARLRPGFACPRATTAPRWPSDRRSSRVTSSTRRRSFSRSTATSSASKKTAPVTIAGFARGRLGEGNDADDEPALRGREPVLAHGRHGRPPAPAALPARCATTPWSWLESCSDRRPGRPCAGKPSGSVAPGTRDVQAVREARRAVGSRGGRGLTGPPRQGDHHRGPPPAAARPRPGFMR